MHFSNLEIENISEKWPSLASKVSLGKKNNSFDILKILQAGKHARVSAVLLSVKGLYFAFVIYSISVNKPPAGCLKSASDSFENQLSPFYFVVAEN